MSHKYVKLEDDPTFYLVDEEAERFVPIATPEQTIEHGLAPVEVVTPEELDAYRALGKTKPAEAPEADEEE